MGVVIEMCVKYPGGRTRNRGTAVQHGLYIIIIIIYIYHGRLSCGG
jgi:hypothetical protein